MRVLSEPLGFTDLSGTRVRGFVDGATCRLRVGAVSCSKGFLLHFRLGFFCNFCFVCFCYGSRSQRSLVVEDDAEGLREVTSSRGPSLHESRIANSGTTPLGHREVVSSPPPTFDLVRLDWQYKREYQAKVASRSLVELYARPLFYIPKEEDLPKRDKKGAPRLICRVLVYGDGNMKVYDSKLDGVAKLWQFW
ncbi:uncharacterized protein G2W53_032488 [Senna tora]|uniref:Uncharacterized protein n=1 Tax=Senna tora TaxID=362788 RepID=A0A834SYE6_9FABA|nr:uncharacterized protein G2W53_032488 [Senna tora]